MTYKVEIVSSAQTQFKKLHASLQERITPKLIFLKDNPRPFGSQKLRDSSYYRIRVGDYRVIYSVEDRIRLVRILDIAHRREIYR